MDDGRGSTNYPPIFGREGNAGTESKGKKRSGARERTVIVRSVHQKEISTNETKENSKERNKIDRTKLEGNKEIRTQAYNNALREKIRRTIKRERKIKMPQPTAQRSNLNKTQSTKRRTNPKMVKPTVRRE